MRVLFVGHCNDVYVGYLNRIVKQYYPNAVTGVVDLNYSGNDLELRKTKFDLNYSLNTFKRKYAKKSLVDLVKIYSKKKLYRRIVKLQLNEIKSDLSYIKHKTQGDFIYGKIIEAFKPTHVHVHYLNSHFLKWTEYVPKNVKLILTFWGSDLMAMPGGLKEYNLQYNALQKASVITTHTVDMRTILLSKFGQDLLPKIACQTFDPLSGKSDMIKKSATRESRIQLRQKYNVALNKICIQVGYSSAVGQNHLEIFKQINALPEEQKNSIAVFVPLSYNAKGNYVSNLLEEAKSMSYQVVPILEYISDEEMIDVIAGCDIFISMRENDALNAAMVEALFAGNQVITGAWLPYGIYLRAGVKFASLTCYSDVKSCLETMLKGKLNSNEFSQKNREIIEQIYNPDQIAKAWSMIYN